MIYGGLAFRNKTNLSKAVTSFQTKKSNQYSHHEVPFRIGDHRGCRYTGACTVSIPRLFVNGLGRLKEILTFRRTSVSTTLTVSPPPSSTSSENDIVSRTDPAGPTTPCATLYVVKSNGTVTLTPGGMGPKPGASGAGTGSAASSGYVASTATPIPSSFEGSASNGVAVSGGLFMAIGMAALLL